jgi:hypothetical protein
MKALASGANRVILAFEIIAREVGMQKKSGVRIFVIGSAIISFCLAFCGPGFALNAPKNIKSTVTCHGNNGTVVLNWAAVEVPEAHKAVYNIYFSTSSKSGPWNLAQEVNTNSYTFIGDCSTNLFFKVTAAEIDASGYQLAVSSDSEIIVVPSSGSDMPQPVATGRGCNLVSPLLTATVDEVDPYGTINLSWTNESCGVVRFDIIRSDGKSKYVSDYNTYYQDSGLAPGTTYRYQIRARNNTGQYVSSNWASASTR